MRKILGKKEYGKKMEEKSKPKRKDPAIRLVPVDVQWR